MKIYKIEKYIAVSGRDGCIPNVYDHWANTVLETRDLAEATGVFRELQTRQYEDADNRETILEAYTIEQADRKEYDDFCIDRYVKTIVRTAPIDNGMWCWG